MLISFLNYFFDLSPNANECIEKSNGGLPYLTIFKFSCNNQASCDLLASLVTLGSCGGKSADYLHIDYYCKDGN